MSCLFCSIAVGDIPSHRVYEDEHALAFLDINPTNHGHTLVIPKKHSVNLLDIDAESLAHMMNAVQKVAHAMVKGLEVQSVNVLHNAGKTGGQVIMHTHMHVVPRHADDGLKHWPGSPYANEAEAQTVADKIASAM